MARNSPSGILTFLILAVAVVLGGLGIGYVLGGARQTRSNTVRVVAPPPAIVTPRAPEATVPHVASPRSKRGEYTAPGAPQIQIVEERSPSLTTPGSASHLVRRHGGDSTSRTKTDSEASQEGAANSGGGSSAASDGSASSSGSDNGNSGSGTTSPSGSPADPDYETTGPSGDSEASQQAGHGSGTTSADNQAEYRVQTGAFGQARNARILADALRARGYDASARAEHDGDRVVYKVQTGAFRTKDAADKAALDLKRNGYAATVSPTSP